MVKHRRVSIKRLWVRIPTTAEIYFRRELAHRVHSTLLVNEYRLSVAVVLLIELGLIIRVCVLN